MDLYRIMEDRQMLTCIATDLLNDVNELDGIQGTVLYGDTPMECQADVKGIKRALVQMQDPDAKLWKLQYAFLVVAYLSDALVKWLTEIVQPTQMKYWFDGHKTLPGQRERFVEHVIGKFSEKTKKGSRKVVLKEATTPQMLVVSEYLLAHTLVSWK